MNKANWFNIPTNDMARAAEFYKTVFGWKVLNEEEATEERLRFRMIATSESDESFVPKERGVINGSLVSRQMTDRPTIMVTVDDIDKVVKQVAVAGGEVIGEKIDLPPVGGRFQFIKDSEGNVIQLWENIIQA